MKKNKVIPKYKFGGINTKDKQNVKNFFGNTGALAVNTVADAAGANTNVIDYKGRSANTFNQVGNVTGGVAKVAAPMVASVFGGPLAGQAVSGLQNTVGAVTPQEQMTGYDSAGRPIYDNRYQDSDKSAMIGQFAGMGLGLAGKAMSQSGESTEFAFGGMKYPMGGANAEIESKENVVAPNGGFLQADGPTHNQGGVAVNIPDGAKIFSDRLKAPGTKKTFAELNKPNNTNKEDKILESSKHGNISKHTAELMKLAKNKNSDAIFAEQEALKQAKVEAYAKKMGVTLPQPNTQVPQEFAMGGVKLPMYTNKKNELPQFWGGGTKRKDPNFTPPAQSYQFGRARFLSNGQLDQTDPLARVRMNVEKSTPKPYSGNSNYISPEDEYNRDLAAANARITQDTSKPNWMGMAEKGFDFAAQNAGNIYDLLGRKKTEVEKYDRLKPTYLDPTASLRDADMQSRRAEYNVRGASGGNAGTYLGNRVALNAQNVINKDRIAKEYQNANAGISNQIGQYNNELSRAEVIANAQNRAVNDNIRRQAIGSIGSNFGQATLSNKKGEMDQNTLDLMMKYYDTPEFKRMMAENKFKK